MSRTAKTVPPQSATETEGPAFWESHDSTDHIDWSKAEKVRLPNLKPSSTAISLRLPNELLERGADRPLTGAASAISDLRTASSGASKQ